MNKGLKLSKIYKQAKLNQLIQAVCLLKVKLHQLVKGKLLARAKYRTLKRIKLNLKENKVKIKRQI
jgi:hypothetical protein